MTDNPVELDEHRGMAAQKSTEIRRRLYEVQADQAALRRRQEEFECHALAAPSTSWAEAAAEARYLILLFAETSEARNPRRKELIAKVLDDLARLSDWTERRPLNAVYVALTEIGFCFIVNHGVPSGQIHAVFRQATRFHALPLQKKLEVQLDKHNVGYLPMRGDTLRTSGGRARRPG